MYQIAQSRFNKIFFYKITLHTGAIVWFAVGDWINYIHVIPSIFDEDNVDGMCGNPNNIASDDFVNNLSYQCSTIEDRRACEANQAVWRYSY